MYHISLTGVFVMDLSQRDRLSQLVEELTTSGQPQLNQDKMKEIKKICKCVSVWLTKWLSRNQYKIFVNIFEKDPVPQ